jgi:RND family efflux transporter MFP subunit
MSVRARLALTAMCGVVCASACTPSGANSSAAPAVAVDVTTVARRTIAISEVLDGQIDPYLQATLAPQQSGTLLAVYANEGDRVRKGAVLAKIDDAVLRANLLAQQGAAAQSAAKLAESQIQLPITDVAARSSLEDAEHARELAKKQQVADAANVANAKLTYESDRSLLAQGYVSETSFVQAQAAYVAARQTLASDNDKLAQADALVRQARQSLANTPLQRQVIVENRGALAQSQGTLEQYRTAIGQTTLVAPFDGIVTARALDPGSFAGPNQAIFTIAELDPVYVDFNLKDEDLADVGPGTPVTFWTSARPDRTYAVRVTSVNAQPAGGTLLYRARIVERNGDFALRGGMQVSVRVTKSIDRDALVVPRAAVVQNGKTGTIYAVERSRGADGRAQTIAREITVRLGAQTDDVIAIAGSGVRAGMSVVLSQVDTLHDGAVVTLPSPPSR